MTGRVSSWAFAGKGGPLLFASSAVNGLADTPHRTWAFRRAELTAFAESPFRCRNGFRATMAHVRSLPVQAIGLTRLLPLATEALEPLVAVARGAGPGARLAVLAGLGSHYAEPGPEGRFAHERRQLEGALLAFLEHRGLSGTVRTVPDGHAAFARAVLDAELLLREDLYDFVAVGGLDTAYDPDVVERLLDSWRLFDGEKLDSIIPAEGAAFLLLGRRGGLPAIGRLLGVAIADEPGTMENDVPCMALALTRAAREAMRSVRDARERVDLLFSDLTHEHYRIHELQLALPRLSRDLSPDHAVQTLYPHLGDLGAAAMPTALAVALEGFERGDPAGSTAVALGTSVGPLRGAVCISA